MSPPRVAELCLISREIVMSDLLSFRAMERTPVALAHSKAISSRSAKDRLRFLGQGNDGAKCVEGIPPELRNHRIPTGAASPASTAASSLDSPFATARQNRLDCHVDRQVAFPKNLNCPGSNVRTLVYLFLSSTPPLTRCCEEPLDPPWMPAGSIRSCKICTASQRR